MIISLQTNKEVTPKPMQIATREQWLLKGVDLLSRKVFKPCGYSVPNVKISIGFTGARNSKKVLGACWSPEASSDGVVQIFIVPTKDDSNTMLGILAHELVHAVVGNDKGHGPIFKKCALAIGLTGKMTSAMPGKELTERLNGFITDIGTIPHARLNIGMSPKKKQSTRMIKAECLNTQYKVRLSQKCIDEHGAPICPCCNEEMNVDGLARNSNNYRTSNNDRNTNTDGEYLGGIEGAI